MRTNTDFVGEKGRKNRELDARREHMSRREKEIRWDKVRKPQGDHGLSLSVRCLHPAPSGSLLQSHLAGCIWESRARWGEEGWQQPWDDASIDWRRQGEKSRKWRVFSRWRRRGDTGKDLKETDCWHVFTALAEWIQETRLKGFALSQSFYFLLYTAFFYFFDCSAFFLQCK